MAAASASRLIAREAAAWAFAGAAARPHMDQQRAAARSYGIGGDRRRSLHQAASCAGVAAA